MSYVLEDSTEMTALANAIRTKTGSNASMSVSDMTTAVSNISSGGSSAPSKGVIFTTDNNGEIIAAEVIWSGSILPVQFGGCPSLETITIPDTITQFPAQCFSGLQYLEISSLPSYLTYIGDSCFKYCSALTINSLPSGVMAIGSYAFQYCSSITTMSLPVSLTTVGSNAFQYCSGLTSVVFNSSESMSIGNNAFAGCPNLTDIYVPWSEGAVGRAPWGATNATIHYNYSPSQ